MTRKEGYLVLDKIFKDMRIDYTSLDTILKSDRVEQFGRMESKNFSFVYLGFKYFYKPCTLNHIDPYFELIAEELLADFNLPSVSYDLATVAGVKGVISKDFRKEGANYISGSELLKNFYKDDSSRYNNLEDIWYALEYRYRDNPNKDTIVSNLMNRFVDLFIFDIFTNQRDRHSNNYQIMEYNNQVDIAPVCDNEDVNNFISSSIMVDRLGYIDIDENLKHFIEVSDSKYSDRMLSKLWVIDKDNLEKIFVRIEVKTGYRIPRYIRDDYLNKFSIHRSKIRNIINRNSLRKR